MSSEAGDIGAKLGEEFLSGMDEYLKKNLRCFKRSDVPDCYSGFFNKLKDYRGCSHGFNGLSEFIIFRLLYHLLGGNFEIKKSEARQPKTNSVEEFVPTDNILAYFESKDDTRLRIQQNVRVKLGGKSYSPDISILYGKEVRAIIEIKIVLTNGETTIKAEVDKLKNIKEQSNKMKALLIIFSLPQKSKMLNKLDVLKKDNKDWFNFCVLNDSSKKDNLFIKELKWVTETLPIKR